MKKRTDSLGILSKTMILHSTTTFLMDFHTFTETLTHYLPTSDYLEVLRTIFLSFTTVL